MSATLSVESHQERLFPKVRETLLASGNCAQTAFAVLQEEFDLEGGEILKALTPFQGIALRGETCGAVTGCLMALGLVYGRDDLNGWRVSAQKLCPDPSRRVAPLPAAQPAQRPPT